MYAFGTQLIYISYIRLSTHSNPCSWNSAIK